MRARFAIMDRASGWLASAVQRVSRRAHDTETTTHDLGSIDLSVFRRRMSGDCRAAAPPVPFAVLNPHPFATLSIMPALNLAFWRKWHRWIGFPAALFLLLSLIHISEPTRLL